MQIFQCITINLTLLYAILAYYGLKKSKFVDEANESLLVSAGGISSFS